MIQANVDRAVAAHDAFLAGTSTAQAYADLYGRLNVAERNAVRATLAARTTGDAR